MFELLRKIKIFGSGIFRLGQFRKNGNKIIETPCYFLISNFGGGGTNVSRFISYLHIFEEGESQLLLNYYYLNNQFPKTPAFDSDSLSMLPQKGDILQFLKEVRENFIKHKKRIIPNFRYKDTRWTPIVLLDSGSGNIFRDLIRNKNITTENFARIYQKEILEYLEFGARHKFDILISMDIAEKYTAKKGEHLDDRYKKKLAHYRGAEYNRKLLKMALKILPKEKQPLVFAPLHGNTTFDYLEYLNMVLQLENNAGKKFAGFAIGGLGGKKRKMIYEICGELRKTLEQIGDNRPIHVLGVGALQNLIPLCLVGVDSFDCHSPWRRASEGKIVIPLINSKGKVIQNIEDYWDYIPIRKYKKSDYKCDCPVCLKYSLNDLKKLYRSGNEQTYFAKILFFKHNISQQEFTLKAIRTNVEELISTIPDGKYKKSLEDFLDTLNRRP